MSRWRGVRIQLVVVVALAEMASWAYRQGEVRRVSTDDLPKIVRVSDPQIAPDGKSLAFVVCRAKLKEERLEDDDLYSFMVVGICVT